MLWALKLAPRCKVDLLGAAMEDFTLASKRTLLLLVLVIIAYSVWSFWSLCGDCR